MAKSSRCSQSVALSSWTTHILYGWNFKPFYKIVRTNLRLNLISRACLRADRPGLRISACLTLSMFSGVRTVLLGPGGFFFTILPVVLRLWIVLRLGTVSRRPSLKWTRKKPLHCCDRLTILHIRIISKHALLYRPLLHSYWNGIV